MKNRKIRAFLIGLSAVTLAGSANVTAYAVADNSEELVIGEEQGAEEQESVIQDSEEQDTEKQPEEKSEEKKPAEDNSSEQLNTNDPAEKQDEQKQEEQKADDEKPVEENPGEQGTEEQKSEEEKPAEEKSEEKKSEDEKQPENQEEKKSEDNNKSASDILDTALENITKAETVAKDAENKSREAMESAKKAVSGSGSSEDKLVAVEKAFETAKTAADDAGKAFSEVGEELSKAQNEYVEKIQSGEVSTSDNYEQMIEVGEKSRNINDSNAKAQENANSLDKLHGNVLSESLVDAAAEKANIAQATEKATQEGLDKLKKAAEDGEDAEALLKLAEQELEKANSTVANSAEQISNIDKNIDEKKEKLDEKKDRGVISSRAVQKTNQQVSQSSEHASAAISGAQANIGAITELISSLKTQIAESKKAVVQKSEETTPHSTQTTKHTQKKQDVQYAVEQKTKDSSDKDSTTIRTANVPTKGPSVKSQDDFMLDTSILEELDIPFEEPDTSDDGSDSDYTFVPAPAQEILEEGETIEDPDAPTGVTLTGLLERGRWFVGLAGVTVSAIGVAVLEAKRRATSKFIDKLNQ